MRALHQRLASLDGLPDAAREVLAEANLSGVRATLSAAAARASARSACSVDLSAVPVSTRHAFAAHSTDPVLLSSLCSDPSERVRRAAVFNSHTPWAAAAPVVLTATGSNGPRRTTSYVAFCGKSDSGQSWYAASLMALCSAHPEAAGLILADVNADGTALRAALAAPGVGPFLPAVPLRKLSKALVKEACSNPDVPREWLMSLGLDVTVRDELDRLLAGDSLDVATADPSRSPSLVAFASQRIDLALARHSSDEGTLVMLASRRQPCPDGFVFAAVIEALSAIGSPWAAHPEQLGSRARVMSARRWSPTLKGGAHLPTQAELLALAATLGENEMAWRLALTLLPDALLSGADGMSLEDVAAASVLLAV